MHPLDKIPSNSTLEIKPVDVSNQELKNFKKTTNDYFTIEIMSSTGNFVGELKNGINITQLRIFFSKPSGNWILVNEFGLL